MLQRCFEALRPARPMVHCITNSVTINDCANVLLAAGARPIMADDPEESAEITAACRALVLNLGMLSPRKLEAMVKSGHQANRMGIPVVLDPVGAGASALRIRAAHTLLEEVRFAAVRGNGSEIRVLAAGGENHGGVDAAPGECAPEQERAMAEALARRIHAVVAVTGETDLVTDGTRAARCLGGCAEMGLVTGTGCMLSALTGALLAASPEQPFAAVCTAVCAMKTAGELARAALAPDEGSGSYRVRLIDAVNRLDGPTLAARVQWEEL